MLQIILVTSFQHFVWCRSEKIRARISCFFLLVNSLDFNLRFVNAKVSIFFIFTLNVVSFGRSLLAIVYSNIVSVIRRQMCSGSLHLSRHNFCQANKYLLSDKFQLLNQSSSSEKCVLFVFCSADKWLMRKWFN